MEGRELRRSVTLSEQLAVADSCHYHLGDLLNVREEDEVRPSAAAAGEKSGRTLLDIIREEQVASGVVVDGNSGHSINWKSFKDRLRLRRAGAAWASSSSSSAGQHYPIADPENDVSIPVLDHTISSSISVRNSQVPVPESTSGGCAAIVTEYIPAATAAAASEPAATPQEEHPSGRIGGNEEATDATEASASTLATGAAAEEQPVRVSLMALLEQTDRQWGSGGEGSSPPAAAAAAAAEDVAEDVGGGMLYMCCVCLVRHKGAAFIPCGHTFCRLCSRELWVSRGNCPLCNGFILEILDIF